MIFLVMGIALAVLVLWSIVSTPRVIRRTGPRMWAWWAYWICVGSVSSMALLRQGWEVFQ